MRNYSFEFDAAKGNWKDKHVIVEASNSCTLKQDLHTFYFGKVVTFPNHFPIYKIRLLPYLFQE